MSNKYHFSGPVAFLPDSGTAVYFSKSNTNAGVNSVNSTGTAAPVKEMQSALKVAYWGEDNRFPQNIEQQMAYCGIGKAALDWKARVLCGNGIIPGKVIDYDKKGNEIFKPLDKESYKTVYDFLNKRSTQRFLLEYTQDWVWYNNCFPEIILDVACKNITDIVHQESCDCRFRQMNDNGVIDTIYLSKLWGAPKNQFAKFDDKKSIPGLPIDTKTITEIDNKYVKSLDAIDMYNPMASLKSIASKLSKKPLGSLRSAILPVNYPSPNKTYYQVPAWDGARLAGWVEIISKIPSLLKSVYERGMRIKNHVQIPETYFYQKYGRAAWIKMEQKQKDEAKEEVLKSMYDYLTGSDNAYSTLVTFFDVNEEAQKDFGKVTITELKNELTIDKDLLVSSAGNIEFLIAAGIHPSLFNAGMPGSSYRSGGGSGSDIREAYNVYTSTLTLERKVMLEPFHLVKDFNREVGGNKQWEEDIEFRFRDTVLTTLDTGADTSSKQQ